MIAPFAHSLALWFTAHSNEIAFGSLAAFCIVLAVDIARTKSNPYL